IRQAEVFYLADRAAVVAALAALSLDLLGQLVAGHGQQQLHQVVGLAQLELPGSNPDEETGQDALANVHRIEQSPRALVAQSKADVSSNVGLVLLHQVLGGLLVAGPDAPQEFVKRRRGGHGSLLDSSILRWGLFQAPAAEGSSLPPTSWSNSPLSCPPW